MFGNRDVTMYVEQIEKNLMTHPLKKEKISLKFFIVCYIHKNIHFCMKLIVSFTVINHCTSFNEP